MVFVITSFCGLSSAAEPDIVVGRTLSLDGPTKSYGEAKRDGGDAYIAKINAAGGINGRKIQVLTMDDAYTPSIAVENFRKLASESKPVAFLSIFGLPVATAILPVADELKIPVVGLSSGSAELRKPEHRYIFPVRADYQGEAKRLVGHVKTIGFKRFGVVFTDNPFGEGVNDVLQAELASQAIVPTIAKMKADAKGVEATVKTVADARPDAVFLVMLSQAAIPAIFELRKAGYKGPLYAFSPVDGTQIIKKIPKEAVGLAISQIVPIPDSSRVPAANEYMQALKLLGRGEPSFYGFEGFLEAKVLVEGLKRAGPKATPENLQRALETIKDVDLGGFRVSYGPGAHTGSTFVEIGLLNSVGQFVR